MKCINCNQEINDGTPICYHCGAVQSVEGNSAELPQQPTPQVPPVAPPIPVDAPPIPADAPSIPVDAPPIPVDAPPIPAAAPPIPPVEPPVPNMGPMPDFDEQDKTFKVVPEKKGMSALAKWLLICGIVFLLAAIAGGVYYFLKNKVSLLEAGTDEVTFACKGGEKTIEIITDAKDIEVTECPEWAEVEILDSDEITIKCDSLSYPYDDRQDIICIEAGNKRTTITIKQSSNATYINPTSTELYSSYDDEAYFFEFDTDGSASKFDYDVEYEGYDQNWLEIEKGVSSVTFKTEPNFSSNTRHAIVTVTSGNCQATIYYNQYGKCNYCDGIGKKTCYWCSGSGEEYDYDLDEYVDCSECSGQGVVTCSECNGSGNSE